MILLGTVLLEPNRWRKHLPPALPLAAWLPRIAAAGFDGLELWENHWHLASPADRAALLASPVPIRVFNTYATPDQADAFAAALDAARALSAPFAKFNVANSPAPAPVTLAAPPSPRLRCECHPGTPLETPEAAAAWLARLPADAPPCEVIVHPFALPPADLARWFTQLGPRITAAHVQCRDEAGRWSGIARHPARSREVLRVLRDHGFTGDFTIEFTAGTASEQDTPENLWPAALADLAFLRSELP